MLEPSKTSPATMMHSISTPKLLTSSEKSATLQNRTASYKWTRNSCWIDSALECLWACVMRDYASFEASFSMVPPSDPATIYDLYQRMDHRRTLYLSQDSTNYRVSLLSAQRDAFRDVLLQRDLHWNNRKVITSNSSQESLFVCISARAMHHSNLLIR